jgi:TonB family protein
MKSNERDCLRVAVFWNDSMQTEATLRDRRPIAFGTGSHCIHELPEDVGEDRIVVFEPRGDGYAILLHPALDGDVWIGGTRTPVAGLRGRSEVVLDASDYGVLSLGSLSIFFQHVRPARRMPRAAIAWDDLGGVASAIALALFIATSVFVAMFAGILPELRPAGTELPPDLMTQYLVTPPPEMVETAAEPTQATDEAALQTRDESASGDEGRAGPAEAPDRETRIEGPREPTAAERVRELDLLGALSGGDQNPIASALDVPDIGAILGASGDARTILGNGPGRGRVGRGPNPRGHELHGAGNVDRSIEGVSEGEDEEATGRARAERRLFVRPGRPSRNNDYLTEQQIARVVRLHRTALRYCYELEAVRRPNLTGSVRVQWRIDLSGRVSSARIATSSLRDATVEGCVVRQVRGWRFPEPDGGEVIVTHPFMFGIEDE